MIILPYPTGPTGAASTVTAVTGALGPTGAAVTGPTGPTGAAGVNVRQSSYFGHSHMLFTDSDIAIFHARERGYKDFKVIHHKKKDKTYLIYKGLLGIRYIKYYKDGEFLHVINTKERSMIKRSKHYVV